MNKFEGSMLGFTKEEISSMIEEKVKEWNKWMVPRDPARIPRILKLIEERWKKHPDLRFFQFLEALFGCPVDREKCFFYQEDDVTERILKEKKHLGWPYEE